MIPKHLWEHNILNQSEALVEVYKNKLISLSMLEHAKNATEDGNGATGGLTEEETHKHFAERFLTSSARVQFITINPRGEFDRVSKDLQTTFLSGNISVLDIPAGTGAGILSLLCNIAELRMCSHLPRLPLHIYLTGGDYSASALMIYNELLDDIKVHLANQLIYIHYQVIEWDAQDVPSTNILLDSWFSQATDTEEYYILVPAFSGVGSSIYKRFEDSFKLIQWRVSNLPVTITFIEPQMKSANIFIKFFKKAIDKIGVLLLGIEESTETNDRFNWYDPIRNNVARSGVSVVSYYRR